MRAIGGNRVLLLLGWIGFAALPATACLWDRDTLRDELKTSPSDFDLVTGQIPHHGTAYYQHRVAVLSGTKLTKETRNDLAVAKIRLKQFDDAEKLLRENLKATPGGYFTLSNLGVLEKKRGNFKQAATYIQQALAIRPEGHLGLGDWYLKMLEYRAARAASPKTAPSANFLGVSYKRGAHVMLSTGDGGPRLSPVQRAPYDKFRRLLENDQTFADGFVAMGDHLVLRGDLHLGFLAYTRAIELGHGNVPETRRRRRAVLIEWKGASDKRIRNINNFWREEIAKAEGHLKSARDWPQRFQEVEAQIVRETKSLPSFEETQARMQQLNIKRYRPPGD